MMRGIARLYLKLGKRRTSSVDGINASSKRRSRSSSNLLGCGGRI